MKYSSVAALLLSLAVFMGSGLGRALANVNYGGNVMDNILQKAMVAGTIPNKYAGTGSNTASNGCVDIVTTSKYCPYSVIGCIRFCTNEGYRMAGCGGVDRTDCLCYK
ncbi:uncharacterized protein LOC125940255 [Dermacentor silvarum]|uniref:uncharacterized protein LOC125940255 n=1 Tax=Dermacentor silvarum TaxID=543639 RepID=UPI0021015312|nr:uncharacterized protein LOC125940255 [Dermacentor silvarum]